MSASRFLSGEEKRDETDERQSGDHGEQQIPRDIR
jgi:hypothetical protein